MHDALMALVKWTLTASGVGLAALVITPLLRRRYASRGIYALWLVVAAAFLLPVHLPARENAVTFQVPQVVTQPIALRPMVRGETMPTVSAEAVKADAPAEAVSRTEARVAFTPAQAIMTLYVLGAVVLLARQGRRHRRFMRTMRRWAEPVEDTQIERIYRKAMREMGVKRGPELVRCAAVQGPTLAGVLRPRILLPFDAPQGDALALVLRHELVHYRRGDLMLKVLLLAARTLHWFNPMVHLAARMADVYCELSCDERAMRQATLDERALYSQAILHALRRPAPVSALTTSFSADKKTLKRRLTQIMDMHVKKRGVAFALCAVLLTLVIGTSFALADTKDIPTWNAEPMTKEQMLDIYEENFAKMGTTSSIYYTAENLVDQAELDEWLVQWEERYTQETGFDRKDDLIVSTTPGANDMPYDEALAYAKKLLMDKYGTPEEELDAMGVYPRLMDYVYMEDESEWEFFFTPMKDVDIDEDHDYPAPGEYRVHFQARSGEVLLCLWYIDDFWPYAQRTWDAGKHDVVYEQYQKVSFYQQDVESQTHFRTLLKDAGYDVDVERNVLGGIELDLHFAPAEESVLLSEDAYVQTALAAMKETYGLDLDTLQACAFGAFYSSLNTGTVDVCFVFNYNIANQLSEARAGEEAGVWKNLIVNYPVRLGSYMISMDVDTGKAVSNTYVEYERQRENDASAKLLEKWNWTTEDAAAYRELVEVLIPQAVEQAKPNYAEHEAAVHTLLREWGGNADSFPARELEAGMISHESATDIAKNAVMEKDTLTAEEFDALYPFVEADYDYTAEVYHAYAFSRIIDGEDAAPNYYVKIDARSGEILEMDIAVGNG